MKCPICRTGVLETRRENHHYTESGLSNVVLLDIEVERCPHCDERMPAIPRIEQLHRVIAFALAEQKGRLSGEEVRFLRKYLGLSGLHFARTIGVDQATVSRWENNKDPIGPTADRLLRLMVLTRPPVQEYALENLADVAQDDAPPLQLGVKVAETGWQVARA